MVKKENVCLRLFPLELPLPISLVTNLIVIYSWKWKKFVWGYFLFYFPLELPLPISLYTSFLKCKSITSSWYALIDNNISFCLIFKCKSINSSWYSLTDNLFSYNYNYYLSGNNIHDFPWPITCLHIIINII